MKQRILVAVASLLLAALILLLLPPAPPLADESTGPTQPSQPTHSTTQPADPSVRLYTCDAATAQLYDALAAEYTALTGVEVAVLYQPAEDCQTALQHYMEGDEAPTLLCLHSQNQLLAWQDSLLDLRDTALTAALCRSDMCFRVGGRMLAVPVALESYGLLVNAELLATALTRNDIFDLASLTTATQILRDNAVKAFPTPTLSELDAWLLLQGADLDSLRSFLALYLTNSSRSGEAMELFATGQTAFCLGGSWEYATLEAMEDTQLHVRNLDILPAYTAGGLQYVCSTAWGINANVPQEEIDATMAFLTWLVTAGEGSAAPVDQLQTLTPFQDAAWYGNQLEKKLHGYLRTEPAVLQWKTPDPASAELLPALEAYLESSTQETWVALCRAITAARTENGYGS